MKSRQRVWGVLVLALCSIAVNAASSDSKGSDGKASDAREAKDSGALYTVKDGNKVDPQTLMGWKTWRALECETCHGAQQEGLVGPALMNTLKVLTKEEFHTNNMNGRPEKGMPPFNGSKMVQ